jgi:hypothetical protein
MWIHDADAHVYRIEVETEVEVDAHGATGTLSKFLHGQVITQSFQLQ